MPRVESSPPHFWVIGLTTILRRSNMKLKYPSAKHIKINTGSRKAKQYSLISISTFMILTRHASSNEICSNLSMSRKAKTYYQLSKLYLFDCISMQWTSISFLVMSKERNKTMNKWTHFTQIAIFNNIK